MLYLLQVCIADLSRTVSLATPGSRIAALRLTVLATLSGATVEGCNNVRAYARDKFTSTSESPSLNQN